MIENVNNLAQAWWNWMWPMFWQVGALIVVLGAADRLLRKHLWPQLRYALWLLVVVKLVLPPTFALPTGIVRQVRPWVERKLERPLVSSESASAVAAANSSEQGALPLSDFEPAAPGTPLGHTNPIEHAGPAAAGLSDAMPGNPPYTWQAILMAVWLTGVLAVASWSIVRFRRVSRLARERPGHADVPTALTGPLAAAAERLHLRHVPRIVLSDEVCSPGVIGPLRPVLLMPTHGLENLSRRGAEHIFLHELAHVKRGDLIIQTLCLLVQVFYWFNPFLWFVQRRLQHLRETCCDATVVRILRDVGEYRQTILETAHRLLAKPSGCGVGLLGLVEDRSRLLARVRDLEAKPWHHTKLRMVVTGMAVVLVCACVLPMAAATPSTELPREDDLSVLSNDFGRQIEELRQLLDGRLSEIHADQTDDMGMPVAVAHFAGAGNRPLVFHLTRADTAWVVDYFYAGDSDIGVEGTIPSRRESTVDLRFHTQGGKRGQRDTNALADPDPVEAVRKYVTNLREQVSRHYTGQYMFSPSDGFPCALAIFQDSSGGGAGFLAFHLVGENERYRIECMETSDGVMQSPPRPAGPRTVLLEATQADSERTVALDDSENRSGQYTIAEANLQIPEQWQPCAERLRTIYTALKKYEAATGSLPNWLCDLVPTYAKAEDLLWPAEGPKKAYRMPDPQLPCSFGYQYSNSAPGPGGKTCRQWKDEQRSLCGDVVPLVRYYGTDGRCLNLSFDGRIYVSSLVWEQDLDPQGGRLYRSALAQVSIGAAPQEILATGWKEAMGDKNLAQVFRGEYLHRSRGRDYARAQVERYVAQDGSTYYFSRMADFEHMLVTDGTGLPTTYAYKRASRDAFGRFEFARDHVIWERQMPEREEAETFDWRVSGGALPDLNSRPDPYLIQHVLLRSYDQNAGGEQVFTVYDIDDKGTGINEYEIALTLVDEAGVTLPNGTFKARHFLQVQRTASYTWYKKGPGSKTEYWVDDDLTILRIYRHREPYEVILEDYGGTPLARPASAARTRGTFEVPVANRQIPEPLQACAEKLRVVYAALSRYEADKGRMPDWLSELVPDYLQADALFCPADSPHTTQYWRDPDRPCSYCYELNPSELRSEPPLDQTMRHYKLAQRGLFGDVVPIVRCFHHDTVLNLAWNGTVYTSPIVFERLFIPDYSHSMLSPAETPE